MSSGMHLTRSLALVAAIASAFVVTTPAAAQRASLADRVAALEQRAANNQGNVDLLNQVTQLKAEVSSLRSQIEELQQTNEQAQSTARAQYLDLDGRLNRLEGSGVPVPQPTDLPAAPDAASSAASSPAVSLPPTSSAAAPAVAAVGADERASYEAAFDVLKAGRYDESARLFQQFLQQHPDGAYAPNARYWLGESYYVTQNYALALEQFKTLYERYPTHDKAPGALLKVGLSQYGLKQMDAARETLTQVAQKYPGSEAARTADDRLQSIELGAR
jgi:tol-pal system protein YbgF